MAVVDDVTPLSNPPNTPAIHIGSLALQIITSLSFNIRSIPSNVLNVLFSKPVLTMILFPEIFSKSNACKGCPKSCKTKLVMSTILLIGLKPIANNAFFSQLGDSLTVIPEITKPE